MSWTFLLAYVGLRVESTIDMEEVALVRFIIAGFVSTISYFLFSALRVSVRLDYFWVSAIIFSFSFSFFDISLMISSISLSFLSLSSAISILFLFSWVIKALSIAICLSWRAFLILKVTSASFSSNALISTFC